MNGSIELYRRPQKRSNRHIIISQSLFFLPRPATPTNKKTGPLCPLISRTFRSTAYYRQETKYNEYLIFLWAGNLGDDGFVPRPIVSNEYRLVRIYWNIFDFNVWNVIDSRWVCVCVFYTQIQHLLANYDRSVRPSRNAAEPLNITFGLALTQIIDVVSADCGDSSPSDSPPPILFQCQPSGGWSLIFLLSIFSFLSPSTFFLRLVLLLLLLDISLSPLLYLLFLSPEVVGAHDLDGC